MTTLNQWPDALPMQRRESLIRLIYQKTEDESEREQWLDELETAAESDALEMENLLNA
jgi:hypothetical protein